MRVLRMAITEKLQIGTLIIVPLALVLLSACSDPAPDAGLGGSTPTAEPGTEFTLSHMYGGETVEVWIYQDSQPTAEYCTEILELMVPLDATATVPGKPATCEVLGPEALHLLVAEDRAGVLHLVGIKLVLLGDEVVPTRNPAAEARRCVDLAPNFLKETDDPASASWQVECRLQAVRRGQSPATSEIVWASVRASTVLNESAPPPCWLLPRGMQGGTDTAVKLVRCRL